MGTWGHFTTTKMSASLFRRQALGTARCFSTSQRRYAAEVKSLGVIGAGQMGLGIALVAARAAQVPVHVIDNSEASIQKALAFAKKLLDKDVTKQKLTQEQADKARSLLTASTEMDDLSSHRYVSFFACRLDALHEPGAGAEGRGDYQWSANEQGDARDCRGILQEDG